MNHRLPTLLLCCVLLSACSDPKQATLPVDVSKWSEDKSLMEAVKKLDETDKKLFAGYAARRLMATAFGGTNISDATIGDALKTQQDWIDEKASEEVKQKALAEQIKKEQVQALVEMNASLTASLLELKLNPKNYANKQYSDFFSIRIGFKNNATEALEGIKGTVVLRDIFGEVIKRIRLTDDSHIAAGQSYVYDGTIDYNQFEASDKKLASVNVEKIKFDWEPDTYIFASGKKQVMPK